MKVYESFCSNTQPIHAQLDGYQKTPTPLTLNKVTVLNRIFDSLLTVIFLRRWNLIVSRSCSTGILWALMVGRALARLPLALREIRPCTCLLWALIVIRLCSWFLWALIEGRVYAGSALTLVHYSVVQIPYVFSTKLQYFNEAEKLISNAFIISKNEYWVPFMQNEGMRYCLTQQEIISQQRKMGKKTGILYS